MLIPASMEQLDKSDTTLGETSRKQAIAGIRSGFARVLAIQIECPLRLCGEISQVRNGRLHPERHLVLRDTSAHFRIAALRQFLFVKCLKVIEEPASCSRIKPWRVRQKQDRIRARTKLDTLISGRQEATSPL